MSASTLTKLAPTRVELLIPILPDELREAEDRAFRRLAKKAKLPGFRPGKIPRRIFEQTYGAQTITSEAVEDVVPVVYEKAIREHDLEPVDRPEMELVPDDRGKPAHVKAQVEVRPQIDLGQYKGLALTRERTTVEEEEVERSLLSLAREKGTLVPAERPAQLGDVVTLDYVGRIDGEPFEGGSATGQTTELAEDRYIPGFATGIAGMSPGETKGVEARFPDDYQQADLAGKTAIFTVTLHEVKELELPAIDDELAKAVSDRQTLDELRSEIRARLGKAHEERARRDLANQAVDQLLAAHEIALPEPLVARELDRFEGDASGMAARVGMTYDDYLKAVGKDAASVRTERRPEAERRVKATLLLEAIAKAEGIRATPADLQTELQSLARQYGQPVQRIREALRGNLAPLSEGIVRAKTLDFLITSAQIQEATPAGSS